VDNSSLRIGGVRYANALPLEYDLSLFLPQAKIVRGVPSSLAGQLARGELDVAIVSTIELLRNPEYGYVPGLGICSDGPVRSVCLFSKKPPADVETVALDRSSLTSVVLIRILYRDIWNRFPQFVSYEPPVENGLRIADAALSIGDPTLQFDDDGLHTFDLGELWHQLTGLPFVFAVWIVRNGLDPAFLKNPFTQALESALGKVDEIAWQCSKESPLSKEFYLDYFTRCIHYRMDERDEEGMQDFFERAKHIGL